MNEWGLVIVLLMILCMLMVSNMIEFHNKENQKEISIPVVLVVLLTLGWLINIYFLSFQNEYSLFIGKHFSIEIKDDGLQLNEWGDYFAGFFAPVIFLWIVIGVYIQQSEFRNAVTEYKESFKFLEKQSIYTDIQHQNTWFDRNTNILEKYIEKLGTQLSLDNTKTLTDYNKSLLGLTIMDKVSVIPLLIQIIELDSYTTTSLNNLLNRKDKEFIKAITDLKKGYDIIFQENILACKNIAIKFYLYSYYSQLMIENDIDFETDSKIKPIEKYNYIVNEAKKDKIKSILDSASITLNFNYIDLDFITSNLKFNEDQINSILNKE